MDTGFGQNLEGFLIKGNLSLIPSEIPTLNGDGSVEGSGILYFDTIREYNINNGIDLQNVTFKKEVINIPYTKESANLTTASLILAGGISIKNTSNSDSITRGGALTIAGGVSIGKDLNIGGNINVNNNKIINVPLPEFGTDAVNKDYVDNVATKISGDFKLNEIIIGDSNSGDAIRGSSLLLFDETKLEVATPVIISNTTNSNDSNNTLGALIVSGGAVIKKDTYLGGILNLGDNNIVNLATPINDYDAVNKKYVDERKLQGSFTTGQVIIAASVGDEIKGYSTFTFDGIRLSIDSTENINGSVGGTFISYGGISISKDAFIGGKLILDNNIISGVADPINSNDVATKNYVDSKTYGNLLGSLGANQVVVGTTTEGILASFPSFTFDGKTLDLNATGSNLKIDSTENATGLGSGGTFTTLGGASFQKDIFVGGKIILDNNTITGVSNPLNDNDVATKEYVDSKTYGNLLGTFGDQELVVGTSTAGVLASYSSLKYNPDTHILNLNSSGSIILNNTTNAQGLGTGGSFTTDGGASFNKDVFIGGELDVNLKNIRNVADPILNYDAVNKEYVDDLIASISLNISGNTYTLNNNVYKEDIPNFYYTSQVKAFSANVYVKYNNTKCAIFTLYGFVTGNTWILQQSFVGEQTGVNFSIRKAGNQCIIQYTNTNLTGICTIKFSTAFEINYLSSMTQDNYSLICDGNYHFIDIPSYTYDNTKIDSAKITMYITSDIDNLYSMVILNCVQKNNNWVINKYEINNNPANTDDIKFKIVNEDGFAKIQYISNNTGNDYVVRLKQTVFLKNQDTITLTANTLTPTLINTDLFTYPITDNSFRLTLYAFNLTLEQYALYEIQGLVSDNIWKINFRYIGDNLGIKFFIENIEDSGKLSFINTNSTDTYIRYIKSAPTTFEPLSVSKGGTGNDTLLPYAVLRGDGTNPIVGTDDFIYKDKQLILGKESSIVLNNTTNATSFTEGGTLTSYGGASFNKDVYVGGEMYMNFKNIKQVADPILDYDAVNKKYVDAIDLTSNINDNRIENTFTLSNNVTVGQDVPNFIFPSTVKAFISNVYIEINGEVCALYTIHGLNCNSNWTISTIFTGQMTNIDFNIREENGNGIMQYTNLNQTGIAYIRFKTMSQINDTESGSQINIPLEGNVISPLPIADLEFLNSQVDSVKLIIYVSSETDNRYGLFLSNCILKGNQWIIHTQATGNVQGVHFGITNETNPDRGILNYKNTNLANDYQIRVEQISIASSQEEITLIANTNDPTIVDSTNLVYNNLDTYFQTSVFVHVPDLNKYALFELRGIVCNDIWTINTRYLGDYTGIKFNIYSAGGVGYLTYTNPNPVNATIKYIKNSPLASLKPLQVNKGGTGSSYLIPNAILRGNGKDPVVATNDFVYDNDTLILGNTSSIVLNSTKSATGLTSGSTFISYGGVSINKELLVGTKLVVQNVNITPNTDDIIAEKSFNANNNQNTPLEVNEFKFSNLSTKAFSSMVTITIITNNDIYDALFELKGLHKSSGWALYSTFVGDDTGVDFTIDSFGQIYYTSSNINEWISTKIKFRAFTTTI